MKKRKLLLLGIAGCLATSFAFQLNVAKAYEDDGSFYVLDEDGNAEFISTDTTNQSLFQTMTSSIRSLFSSPTAETYSFDIQSVDPNMYGIVRFKALTNSTYKYTEVDSGREGYFSPNSA